MNDLNFLEGEVILVDKPLNWTSFDVVGKLRYHIRKKYDLKKFKVGHAGTLDPLATGLLILCTGKKTKQIESYMGLKKEYTGTIVLGSTTPSYDLESEINATFPTDHITEELVRETATSFIGEQLQTPPLFSAKKVNGKRAYELARKGEVVELKKSPIVIDEFEITRFELPEIDFRITCGKGTYIRSIAFDFGKAVHSGGHLSSLRRTKIGEHDVLNAKLPAGWVEEIDLLEIE